MKKTKIFNIRALAALIVMISLIAISLTCGVSARNSKQMLRDGMISDEGVTEGDIQDGIISDTPDSSMMPESDSSSTASDSEGSDSEGSTDSILGPGNMMPEDNSGINENDFASGNDTTGDGTDMGEVTADEAGSTVGIVIAIVAILAIIAAIILIVPKGNGRDDRKNKK